ncbi:hypothetical protein HHI36_020706 [Cryptolaemus montrouzieri]|uniref:Dr1-associated corepressor n=1 Tax=Cryptolaemus montrouzieri TaxID=559131 RepID=A0ABD2NC58_9CUCU
MQITQARNAKTLTPSHMKQCILSENRFDFLKDLVKNIPDASAQEDNENNLLFDATMENKDPRSSTSTSHNPKPQTSQGSAQDQSTSRKPSSVIKYGPAVTQNVELATSSSTSSRRELAGRSNSKRSRSVQMEEDDTESDEDEEVDDIPPQTISAMPKVALDNVPPLIPISSSFYSQNRSDSLVIDEDYDN